MEPPLTPSGDYAPCPKFMNFASCPRTFSVSDEHTHCLYCLSEIHLFTLCDICKSFQSRTRDARLLHLCRFLMAEAL